MTEELKEKNRQKSKEYREKNRDAVNAKTREYHRIHSEETNKKRREDPDLIKRRDELYTMNKDKLNAYKNEWRKNNPDKVKKYWRLYKERHMDHIKEKNRKYRINNIHKFRLLRRSRYKLHRLQDNKHCRGVLDPCSSAGIAVITEYVVSTVLGDCENLNKENFCAPYDLNSKKYGTINVKSAIPYTITKNGIGYYKFGKKINSFIPEYYFCIGFDREKTKIDHVWIIPGNCDLVKKRCIGISNSKKGLEKVSCYETAQYHYNNVYTNLDIVKLDEFKNYNS